MGKETHKDTRIIPVPITLRVIISGGKNGVGVGERNARSKMIYLRKTDPVFHITQHAIETKLISRYILVVESGYGDQDAWHPYFCS